MKEVIIHYSDLIQLVLNELGKIMVIVVGLIGIVKLVKDQIKGLNN